MKLIGRKVAKLEKQLPFRTSISKRSEARGKQYPTKVCGVV
jgi:hypothetical protein